MTTAGLATQQRFLEVAVAYFGADRPLEAIRVRDVKAWAGHLARGGGALPGKRLAPGAVRHYLNSLSWLFKVANEEEAVPLGYNPVSAWSRKPRAKIREADWFAVDEVALLLEAARTHPPLPNNPDAMGGTFGYALFAAFSYTGGRLSEVLGLELDDVSFDRRTITFRTNKWRRLKTRHSHRVIPLWPAYERILRPYVFGERLTWGGSLLFPRFVQAQEQMLVEPRELFDRIAERAGWEAGAVRSRAFRHTFAARRLETLDRGQPVSVFTVSRELGHTSTEMVERVYSHLGEVRNRTKVVDYPLRAARKRFGDRVAKLRP